MKTKINVIIPIALVTDPELSLAAKTVYAILKTFQTGKTLPHLNPSIVVTHREIMERSHLSKKTVRKAIGELVKTGWIEQQTNWGSANGYVFVNPTIGAFT
jgi:predicted RNA-binding protein (virulence factor B family)